MGLNEMTFTEARKAQISVALSNLTAGEAQWLDSMDGRPLASETADLPESIFRQLFSSVLIGGPDYAHVEAFHNFFALEADHPHLEAVAALLKALSSKSLQIRGLNGKLYGNAPLRYRNLFEDADTELYHRVTIISDAVNYDIASRDGFFEIVIVTSNGDMFHVLSLFHGFRRHKEIRKWLQRTPEVRNALDTFSRTVYGEDW